MIQAEGNTVAAVALEAWMAEVGALVVAMGLPVEAVAALVVAETVAVPAVLYRSCSCQQGTECISPRPRRCYAILQHTSYGRAHRTRTRLGRYGTCPLRNTQRGRPHASTVNPGV